MPQITTPLAQVLNPQVQQTGTQTGFLAPAAQAGQTRLSTIQNREIQGAQEERQAAQDQFNLMDDKQQQRFKSVALAASELLPSLEKGDVATANKLLDIRRQGLINQGLPTKDTDEFQALINADIGLATTQAQNAIQTAKLAGAIKTPEGSQVPFQLGQSRTVKQDGKLVSVTEVFNRQTGKIDLVETPIEGNIASRDLGETAKDKRERVVLTQAQQKSAAFAQKASADAFAQIPPIREAIGLYNDAIALIDEGADTGVVASKLPSMKDVAIKLDNVQSRLGLNVIRQTTFGSLSEAELKFALDSALPPKLSEEGLRKWLVDKRDAQEKLSNYIIDASIYLGNPGNSIASWFQLQKDRQEQAEAFKPIDKPAAPTTPATGGLTPEEEAELAALEAELGGG